MTNGAVHVLVLTVTVTALLCALLGQAFETRTQYVVVCDGATLMLDVVPFAAGVLVSPFGPMYHWYVSGPVPAAET